MALFFLRTKYVFNFLIHFWIICSNVSINLFCLNLLTNITHSRGVLKSLVIRIEKARHNNDRFLFWHFPTHANGPLQFSFSVLFPKNFQLCRDISQQEQWNVCLFLGLQVYPAMDMDSANSVVLQALTQATSQDTAVLKPAEEQLRQWETQPGFYSVLLVSFWNMTCDIWVVPFNAKFCCCMFFFSVSTTLYTTSLVIHIVCPPVRVSIIESF